MAQTTKMLFIRLDNDGTTINDLIVAKQFDARSRHLGIMLLDENNEPLSLSNSEVLFLATKPDGKQIRDFANVVDSNRGSIIVTLTDQSLAVPGILEAEISIITRESGEIVSRLTTPTFQIKVEASVGNDSAPQSTDEFNDLVDLMNRYWEFHDILNSISVRLGFNQVATDTIFGLLYKYIDISIVEFKNINDSIDNILIQMSVNILNSLKQVFPIVLAENIPPSVKSVQRGIATATSANNISITISTINPIKTFVILNNEVVSYNSGGSTANSVFGSKLISLSNTVLTISPNYRESASAGNYNVSWQVIEFY